MRFESEACYILNDMITNKNIEIKHLKVIRYIRQILPRDITIDEANEEEESESESERESE